MRLHSDQRLILIAALCSVIVVAAGLFALWGALGVQIASGVLTLAAIVACAGFPWAQNRKVGAGIVVLIAAVLPLFGAFYAVGLTIFRSLGSAVAGGLLIGAGTLLMNVTAWYAFKLRTTHSPPAH